MRKSSLKFSLASIAIVLLLGGTRLAKADTIVISDNTQNTATGVFTYNVGFVNNPHVEANDGFVFYGYFGFTGSWSITGGLSASQFTMTTFPAGGDSLNDPTGVIQSGQNAANGAVLPFNNFFNIQFSFNGPPLPDTTITNAILTLDTSVLGSTSVSEYASVDHSSTANNLINLNDGIITIPGFGTSFTPLPRSFWGSSLLFAMLAGFRILKRRPVNA